VLVIACANVANLMLRAARRVSARSRSVCGGCEPRAAHRATPYGRHRAGIRRDGAAGRAVAYFGVQMLLRFLPPDWRRQRQSAWVKPDRVLDGLTAAISLLPGCYSVWRPHLQSTRPALVTALKESPALVCRVSVA